MQNRQVEIWPRSMKRQGEKARRRGGEEREMRRWQVAAREYRPSLRALSLLNAARAHEQRWAGSGPPGWAEKAVVPEGRQGAKAH